MPAASFAPRMDKYRKLESGSTAVLAVSAKLGWVAGDLVS